ncbi:hypothetical protein P0L94_17665 [Microbacter sp. GSS18]|nr:hypothetical protein P0L94_17665 [Microbacter sp. GSS18]
MSMDPVLSHGGPTGPGATAHPKNHGSASDDFAVRPRRGTPDHRRWMVTAILLGGLPVVTLLVGVGSMSAYDVYFAGGDPLWSQIGSVLGFLQILLAVVAFLALLGPRTRVTGIATLVLAAIFNSWTMALLPLVFLGGR